MGGLLSDGGRGAMVYLGDAALAKLGSWCEPGPGAFSRAGLSHRRGVTEKAGPPLPMSGFKEYWPGPGARVLRGSLLDSAPKLKFGAREYLARAPTRADS